MERICLWCSKPIQFGRADKKFCDAGCKDEYYNSIRSLEHREIGKIDLILKRNRRALKELYQSNRKGNIFKWEELIRRGFEFGYQTHVVFSEIGTNETVFCYDYGLKEIGAGTFEVCVSFSDGTLT